MLDCSRKVVLATVQLGEDRPETSAVSDRVWSALVFVGNFVQSIEASLGIIVIFQQMKKNCCVLPLLY